MPEMRRTDARYWLLVLSGCTMGETGADFLSHGPLGLGYVVASAILVTLVVIALVAQHFAKERSEARYWVTIVVMSTAGTTLADALTRTLKLGYFWGSALLVALFLATLLVGRSRKKPDAAGVPVAASPVDALPRTDARYWAAIMVASTLGTTLGDYTSNATRFGFGGSALVLTSLLAVLILGGRRLRHASEAHYWATLITASTIGATTGDFLTKEEGLDLGYYWGNALLIVVFVAIVVAGRWLKPRGAAPGVLTESQSSPTLDA